MVMIRRNTQTLKGITIYQNVLSIEKNFLYFLSSIDTIDMNSTTTSTAVTEATVSPLTEHLKFTARRKKKKQRQAIFTTQLAPFELIS